MLKAAGPLRRTEQASPPVRLTWRAHMPWLATVLLAVWCVVAIARWRYGMFFAIDDAQNEYFPKFYDIGRMLRAGVWPAISDHIWLGNNYQVEFQYGIFNPVQIFLCWLLPAFNSLRDASTVFAVIYLSIAAAGMYRLGDAFGLRPQLAAIGALFAATDVVLLYVYAASWLPGMYSFAWFPWAAAALWRNIKHPPNVLSLIGLVTSTYLLLTAGWPQAIVAFALYGVCAILVFIRSVGVGALPRLAPTIVAAMSGVLLALPAVMEMVATHNLTARPTGLHNAGGFLVPGLRQLLIPHLAAFTDLMNWFGGFREMPVPLGYAGYFLLAIVLLMRPKQPGRPRDPEFLLVALAAGAFLIMSLGPSQLGPLRYPVRFVPYFHCFLLLGALLFAQRGAYAGGLRRWSFFLLVATIGSLVVVTQAAESWSWSRARFLLHTTLLLVGGAVVFISLMRKPESRGAFAAVLVFGIGTQAVIHFSVSSLAPSHLSDPGVPDDLRKLDVSGRVDLPGYALLLAPSFPKRTLFDLNSAQGLLWEMKTINGYSALGGHSGFNRIFLHRTPHGGFEPKETVEALYEQSAGLPITLPTLLGIRAIVLPHNIDQNNNIRSKLLQLGFVERRRLEGGTVWRNERLQHDCGVPNALSGDVRVNPAAGSSCGRVIQAGVSTGTQGGVVVLPRLYWPGYRASVNGTPVAVGAWRGLLVQVTIPPHTTGTLEISYRASTHTMALVSAGLGLLLLGLAVRMVGTVRGSLRGRARAMAVHDGAVT